MRLSELTFRGTFRDYQQKILDDADSYLEDGKIHIVAAPGSGKTTLGLELICRLGKPALILAPSIAIRQQWGERFSDTYLPEGERPESYISYSVSSPSAITCITYQALYSAMSGKGAEEKDEEDPEDEESLPTPGISIKLDVAAIMKKAHVSTICLDEAHHLRTEWHRSITTLLDKLGDNVTVIALTATPPYDSTPAEWKKYTDLCGQIDAEVSIPQLVGQKTLCPHQDLVYFSYPTKGERAEIHALRKRASNAIAEALKSGILEKAFAYFQQNAEADNEDVLYQHIEAFRAFLYCVRESGVDIPGKYHRLISERKKTALFSRSMAQAGCQFVVDNPILFGQEASDEMLAFFRERHVADRKRIDVTADKDISALLASSMGKLGGIQAIVRKEAENLGDGLRMVILTDYIKKNLAKLIGTEDPLVEMGTVPIFEALRRDKIPGARLGVLSGTLTILPDTAMSALSRLALAEECSVSAKPIRDTGFSRVEFSGGNKKKVRIVTKLFQEGEANVLIGTKSLLGEGWDSPCINSLVLASFVGSFMLSNQMRGRAIRTDKGNPDKVSNIWHLITPDVDEGVAAAVSRAVQGDSVLDGGMSLGRDYEAVARRFECFMAPSLKEDVIQSGIERLGIDASMGRSAIEGTNRRMLDLSADRDGARARWDRSIANCANEEMEICQKNEFREETLPTKFGFVNLAACLVLMVATTVLLTSTYRNVVDAAGVGSGLLSIIASVLLYVLFLRGIRYAIRLASPTRLVESIAKSILSAFQQNGTIRSENARVEVSGASNGLAIDCTLRGGTLREKQLFAEAMRELLSPMSNPRYVVLKRVLRMPQYSFSMACPSLLGNNKQNAELFQKELRRQLGDVSVVYVRNEAGHAIYRKCVKRSFVNYEINACGAIVRKEVY